MNENADIQRGEAGRAAYKPGRGPQKSGRARRNLKGIGIGLASIAGLVILLIALLMFPPVRGTILRHALPRILRSVPGELAIESAAWPRLQSFELSGIVWEAGGDSLLTADTVEVDIDLWALVSRDVRAGKVVVHGITADVPGITALFAPDSAGADGGRHDGGDTVGDRGFPRKGVLPGLPSVGVDSISITSPSISLSPDHGITDLILTGGFDLTHGGSGEVRVERLEATAGEGDYSITDLRLHADLGRGMLSGSGSGYYAGGYPLVFAAESSGPDEVTVTLARERGLAPPADPGVLARLQFEREGERVVGIGFNVALRIPTEEEVAAAGEGAYMIEELRPAANASAEIAGTAQVSPELAVRAHCVLRQPDRLDRGMVALEYREGTIAVDSLAVALPQGVTIFTAGAVEITDDDVRAQFEAIVLEPAHEGPSLWKPTGDRKAGIVYTRETRDIEIDGLEVTGGFGHLMAGGFLAGDGSGRLEAVATWPEPPAPLYKMLRDEPAMADSLKAAWALDRPYSAKAAVVLGRSASARKTAADVEMRLPGPRNLAPLFPGRRDLRSMGPVTGSMAVDFETAAGGEGGAKLNLALDLSETQWLTQGLARLSYSGDSVTVDEFIFEAEELRVALDGAFEKSAGSGFARAEIDDAGFLRRFSNSAPDVHALARADFSGVGIDSGSPEINASLRGEVAAASYHVPSLAGTLEVDASGTRARLLLADGLASEHVQLETLVAEFASSSAAGLFPASVSLGARGSEYRLRQRMELSIGDSVICRVDTLDILAHGRDLRAAETFVITFERATGAFAVDGMILTGKVGEVTADGYAGPEGVDFRATADLELPEHPPPGVDMPAAAWPRHLNADLNVPAPDSISLEARIEGFVLDDGRAAALTFNLAAGDTGVTSTMALDAGGARLMDGSLRLPASVTAYPPKMVYRGGAVGVRISLDGYPVMIQDKTPGRADDLVARIDADIKVSGSPRSPAAYFAAAIGFPDWPEMADFGVAIGGAVRPDSLSDAAMRERALELSRRVAAGLGIDGAEDLAAEFVMTRGNTTLLTGNLSYPVILKFDPFEFGAYEEGMDAAVRSDGLPLEDIDVFLPEGVGLEGTMTVDLAAKGPADDPEMDGKVGMRDLGIKIERLVSLMMQGDLTLKGTARKPVIAGNLSIQSGTINLPQKVKQMHPVEGPAILLDTRWRPGADSLEVAAAAPDSASEAAGRPPFEADYDITLDIAHGFWLRGEGLEVELEGKLDIIQKKGLPVISGDLNASNGTFIFLGRIFNLDRGTISFYGEEEINPSLDLVVTSNIESYKLMIRLGGTLEKPEIELTSEPELTEGDIVSMILFGKPLDSLDEGQGDMLRSRTAEIAVAMGAARLSQSLSGQGGVDVVSLRSARGEGDQGSALVVGKYLTPDLLLTYEQALKEKSTSYIVMEYTLNRFIKLETLYSNQSKTGLGVSVEKDY